jgi:phage repressor protein C with HTH and peptisase S24 domain
MTKSDRRRQLLRALIDDKFEGVAARFANAVGITPSYVTRMLYPQGKAGAKGIGEDSIEKIEDALRIPGYFSGKTEAPTNRVAESVPVYGSATDTSYVRVQQLDAEVGMGGETVNEDYPEVIRAMDFTPTYIRSVVGFLPAPGRLVLVTGRGDSMIPIIQPGETLLVDSGVQTFDGDGIYLINTGNGQQVKGLQDRGDAIYIVSANAALYPAFAMPRSTLIGGKVYLRNRIDRFN